MQFEGRSLAFAIGNARSGQEGCICKKCEVKGRKGSARVTLCCSTFHFTIFEGNDDVHPLSFQQKFNILAIEFPMARESRLFSLSFSPVHFIHVERKQMILELFGVESKDDKLMHDSYSLGLKSNYKKDPSK